MRPMAITVMEGEEVTRLARRATAVLAAHGPGRSDGMGHHLIRMSDAFISSDEEDRHEMLTRLRRDGISRPDIIDQIIPAVARLLGERWFADEISFVDVTVGAARLQEAARALGRENDLRDRGRSDADAILIVIPRGEHHMLGPLVLADQMRRRGFAVDTVVDRHPRQLPGILSKRRYRMVGITASGRGTLASARELVETIRASVTRVTPVVIGGSILDKDLDVLSLTGADHTARDAASALMKCKLLDVGSETRSERQFNHAGNGVTGGEG